MIQGKLPPQAFSKLDLARALTWLEGQPEYIRNLASSNDRLMDLYRKSQRQQNSNLKMVEFKADLKDLADQCSETEMNPFDAFKNKESNANFQSNIVKSFDMNDKKSPTMFYSNGMPVQNKPASSIKTETPVYHYFDAQNEATPTPAPAQNNVIKSSNEQQQTFNKTEDSKAIALDAVSLNKIQEIKLRMNQQSDSEVLKLLIAIGYEKLSKL